MNTLKRKYSVRRKLHLQHLEGSLIRWACIILLLITIAKVIFLEVISLAHL